jgi:hypothetical protein
MNRGDILGNPSFAFREDDGKFVRVPLDKVAGAEIHDNTRQFSFCHQLNWHFPETCPLRSRVVRVLLKEGIWIQFLCMPDTRVNDVVSFLFENRYVAETDGLRLRLEENCDLTRSFGVWSV